MGVSPQLLHGSLAKGGGQRQPRINALIDERRSEDHSSRFGFRVQGSGLTRTSHETLKKSAFKHRIQNSGHDVNRDS